MSDEDHRRINLVGLNRRDGRGYRDCKVVGCEVKPLAWCPREGIVVCGEISRMPKRIVAGMAELVGVLRANPSAERTSPETSEADQDYFRLVVWESKS